MGDDEEVVRLSSFLTKLKELEIANQRLESEVTEIARSLNGENESPTQNISVPRNVNVRIQSTSIRKGRKKPPTTFQTEIDWSMNGQPYGTEVIFEKFASNSLVRLLRRLHEVLGNRVLSVASQILINRGPFISQNPKQDYINHSKGELYPYHQIPETPYSVLTGNTTKEKVDALKTLLSKLGLVQGSYTVIKVDRRTV